MTDQRDVAANNVIGLQLDSPYAIKSPYRPIIKDGQVYPQDATQIINGFGSAPAPKSK